ncbi:restriction endonuclease subunit S [Lampropedia cohaerens]|uniref:restriction endonuclease subunit S n=1 Tax=Lampropedia cohaerens TaxID=1610491 RepID=UPI000AE3A4E8|nr:restriction endonuclease subunit S [Lampropedia cohaerens]
MSARRVKFGDVVRLSKARSQDPLADGIERYVGLEHLEPGDLRIRNWGNVADGVTFTSVFQPGQVLFGKRRAYQRKVAVADFSGVCSGDIYVLETKDAQVLLPELLPFICQTDAFFDHAVGTSAGSLSPRTNWTSLADFEFMLPPMDEQTSLVEVLRGFEEAMESAESLSTAAEKLRRSLMIDHFEAVHSECRRVSETGKWYSGGTPSRGNSAYWGGPIPWVSPKDMKLVELDSAEETLTAEGVEAGSKLMPKDTIMIVVRGMILAHTFPVARTLVPAAFNQDMKALVVSDEYRPKYIQYWFEYAAPRYLRLVSESSHGTKRLESEKLFSLEVPKLDLDEQDNFIAQVDEMRAAVSKAKSRRADVMTMKRYFLNQNLAS